MKKIITALVFAMICSIAHAYPANTQKATEFVTEDNGDTIATTQATTACTTGCNGPAQLLAASVTGTQLTGKTSRKRTLCNNSSVAVYIGTQTVAPVLNSVGFRLSESTGAYPCYSTYNTSAIYGQAVGASSQTVTMIQESNSVQ